MNHLIAEMLDMGASKAWSRARVLLLALLAAAGIVLLCTLRYHQFFFIDDAENENIGFYREMGRLWMSGHLPILTTRTMFGGNILVDMVVSPFAPQVIIGSVLAFSTKSVLLVANTMAFIDIAMVILGGYWVGRILMIRSNLSLLLGVLAGSTPCFLYIYSASWWNMAHAYAWLVMAIAALMQFRQNLSVWNFLVAIICGCFLFTSAGTQLQVFYVLMFIPVLLTEWSTHHRLREVSILACVGVCVFCIATVPIMAEYVFNSHLITRSSEFSNTANFMNAEWGHLLNFFDPFYGTYMSWFGGWRYIPLSLGYAGVALLPPLLFKEKFAIPVETKAEWWIVAAGLLLSILASMSPSQMGPLKFSVRFLPVFAFLAAAAALYGVEHWPWAENSRRIEMGVRWLTLVAATFAILQLFSADTTVLTRSSIIFAYLLWVLLRSFLWVVPQRDQSRWVDVQRVGIWSWVCSVLALVGILIQTGSLVQSSERPLLFNNSTLADVFSTEHSALPGVTLSLSVRYPSLKDWDMGSGQLLALGQASVNGYSPVGHVGFGIFFRSRSSHGWFDPKSTLLSMSHIMPNGVPTYQYFGIRRIYAWDSALTPEVVTHMVRAGLTKLTSLPDDRVQIEPADPPPIEGSLTYQSVSGSVRHIRSNGPRQEWFSVAPSLVSRELVFNRIYWEGYHAEIDGQSLPVQAWKNTLVSVTLPPAVSGKLYIHYVPDSWKYTRFSLIGGVIIVLLMSIYMVQYARRHPESPSSRSW